MRDMFTKARTKSEGFTLIEILISMLLTGILATGIIMTIFQIYSQNDRSTRNMVLVQNVESAGYWVNRDTLMAQEVSPSGFPLILDWQDWDGNDHQVVYNLVDNTMQRVEKINTLNVNQTIVARNINTDSTLTDCTFTGGVLNFKITATIDSYSETRIYEIKLRPEPFPD